MKSSVFCLLAALTAATSMGASAAQYYNCATDTGCVASSNVNVNSDYAKVRYPLVFANGMAGFNQVGFVNYWYGVPQDLTQNGAQVYVSKESAFNSSEIRGEQLLTQVRSILALSKSGKVNLIGHSHGGPSVRYVLGVAPQLLASVTTVGSPHTGSPVADVVRKVADTDPTQTVPTVAASIANGLGLLINLGSGGGLKNGYSQDALAGLDALTTAGAAKFNQRFSAGMPSTACGQGAAQVGGIRLYSWSGTRPLTNVLDPSDAALTLTSVAFKFEANDGLVGRCSSHFGTVLRDNYNMNHLDEVNQALGLVSLFETNPKTVFRQHANRLKLAGL